MRAVEILRGQVAQFPGHVFVRRGDPALTRALLARGAIRVISRLKGRKEQIGVAALPEAIEAARLEVEATAGARAEAREKSRERRTREESHYRSSFEVRVRQLFPGIPDEDLSSIVRHTCEVSSRRVGRSKMAKALASKAIELAVRAHIRHVHTDYDARLRKAGLGQVFGRAGRDAREAARHAVRGRVDEVFASWKRPASVQPERTEASGQLDLWQRPLG